MQVRFPPRGDLCIKASRGSRPLTPMEHFLYYYEPPGSSPERTAARRVFRDALRAAIKFAVEQKENTNAAS